MFQQLYAQFKEGKTPPTDCAPWECESHITNDVMGEKNKTNTLKFLGRHVPAQKIL